MNLLKQLYFYFKYGPQRPGLIDEIDERNFGAETVLQVTKKDIPVDYFVTFEPELLDQMDSDFCTGFSQAYGSDATENDNILKHTLFSGAYSFATNCKVMNRDWREWGASILGACKAKATYGICRKELWDYKRSKRDYFANFDNIPLIAHEDAKKHRAGSYWQVRMQDSMDMYDTMAAILSKYRSQRIVIHTGRDGHAWTLFGFHPSKGLKRVDSYGDRTLDKGFGWVDRATANSLFTPYVVLDMERELAELLVTYNGKAVKTNDSADCYLVKNGKRQLLKNEAIAWAHNTLLFDNQAVNIITGTEMDAIPLGEPALFKDGQNWQIVQRILEKTNQLQLLDE